MGDEMTKKAMGLITKKIYAEGETRTDVMRQLHERFPSFEEREGDRKREAAKSYVLSGTNKNILRR